MKKTIASFIILLTLLCGCTGRTTATPDDEIIVIGEKFFLTQILDVYLNSEDYLGKTISYEGIFQPYKLPHQDEEFYMVIRYGPGCCGDDDMAGLEIVWANEYPAPDDWVEVVGILEEYEYDGNDFLRLNVSSLTVMQERGAELVFQ